MANGMLGGLKALFENPAFLQALFGTGLAINEGAEVFPAATAGVLQYHQQQQAANAQAELLRQLLSQASAQGVSGQTVASAPINTGGFSAGPPGTVLGNPVEQRIKWKNPDTNKDYEFVAKDKNENTEAFGTNIRPEELTSAKSYEALESPSDIASKMALGGANLGQILGGSY